MDYKILESERNDKIMNFFLICLTSPYSGEVKILQSKTWKVVAGNELDLVGTLRGQK